ncbi:MAG: citramalate synthase [Candidatus Omnitrophica bacterium]|nr:citramalate synthase [Candidatus Omnitrophota bacterium]
MKKILYYDTTLRDGMQMEGISLSLDDKLKIARRLDRFGIHYVEGGWPGSNPKDLNFFKALAKSPLKQSRLVAFGSTRRARTKVTQDDNVKGLLNAKTKAVAIFGKSWDFHVTEVFGTSLKENLAMIHETVHYLKSRGLEVIYDAEHFFDGYFANPDYALETIKEAIRAGADCVSLCDTNGGMTSLKVREAVRAARDVSAVRLGIHCHNDSGLAVANSVAAVEEGCTLVQGTMNGYGERCGNADLMSIMPVLQFKLGMKSFSDEKMKELTELSRYAAEICNMPFEARQPFVGESAFAHKAGVHVNAMIKNAKTYEHLDPALVGNKRRFLISELSGKTNVLAKAKELNLKLDKDSPLTHEILKKVRDLENEGYQFEAAEASFELLVKRMMGRRKKFFSLKEFKVVDEKAENKQMVSEATVKLNVNGIEEHTAASGDGPVNALDNALRKALKKFYPVVEKIHLVDYKVRVINSEAGTAAKVRVFIQFRDDKTSWQTVGVSENIIDASWQALVEAIEYKLLKDK